MDVTNLSTMMRGGVSSVTLALIVANIQIAFVLAKIQGVAVHVPSAIQSCGLLHLTPFYGECFFNSISWIKCTVQ